MRSFFTRGSEPQEEVTGTQHLCNWSVHLCLSPSVLMSESVMEAMVGQNFSGLGLGELGVALWHRGMPGDSASRQLSVPAANCI